MLVSRSVHYDSRRGQSSYPTRHRQLAGIEEKMVRRPVQSHENGVRGLYRESENL